jgi:hypothetical protein
MSTDAVAIIGFIVLFMLMLLRVPVGMAMGLVGVSGFGYIVGGWPALKMVGQTSMRTVTDYTFGVIPMFRRSRPAAALPRSPARRSPPPQRSRPSPIRRCAATAIRKASPPA